MSTRMALFVVFAFSICVPIVATNSALILYASSRFPCLLFAGQKLSLFLYSLMPWILFVVFALVLKARRQSSVDVRYRFWYAIIIPSVIIGIVEFFSIFSMTARAVDGVWTPGEQLDMLGYVLTPP